MATVCLVTPSVHQHLEKLLETLNISNYSLDISRGSVNGDNFLGVIASVKVNGKNKEGEDVNLNLIVKSAPTTDIYRKFFPVRVVYGREIYIYNDVLPKFGKFQEDRNIKTPFESFAKFYVSTMDDMNEALVMENMKTHGFKMWDRFQPVDYNHALIVVRNYGKLHALSFAIRDQNPELFKKLAGNTEEGLWLLENSSKEHTESMGTNVDRALEALDPIKHEKAYKKLQEFREDMMDKLYEVVKSKPAGDYAVIGHGDCWINNFLFNYGDSEHPTVPTEVCFLDWQLSRLGSPALDIGYFIFTCTDKDLRDEHYEDLINEYYNSLCSFLRELGSDPEKLFPYKVLQEHLKRFSVYGLFMAVMILYFISSDSDEIPDMNSIQDAEEAKQKFSYVSKNIEKYRSRIRGVILDFIKYDYYF